MSKPLSISYWGSPYISALLFQKLLEDPDFEVRYVLSQGDKPRSNRSREVQPTPVKKAALEAGIPVYTPASLKKLLQKDPETYATITSEQVDLHVIFAYGKIIPEELFNAPRLGSVNFHASILPLLRGASPIESALLEDFQTTGWTMQRMVQELDAGDVLAKTEIDLPWEYDANALTSALMESLLEFAPRALVDYNDGKLTPVPQNASEATFCGKFTTEMGLIDWSQNALTIRNLARALQGRSGVYSHLKTHGNKKIKLTFDLAVPKDEIIASQNTPEGAPPAPGAITKIDSSHIWIACGDSLSLPVSELQLEGRKRMSAQDFANGYRVNTGDLIF